MALQHSGTADESPPFTWLERRADGCLIVLVATLVVAVPLIRVLSRGLWENVAILVGSLVLGVGLGLPVGRKLGQPYVGGMFLRRWYRMLNVVLLIGLVGAGIWLAVFSRPAKVSGVSTPVVGKP